MCAQLDAIHCEFQSITVSHTTDELVFKWETDDPLLIDYKIQLPQLALVDSVLDDCKCG